MKTKPWESVCCRLDALHIPYQITEHDAVFTMQDTAELPMERQGEILKNLFLREKKGDRFFLFLSPGDKRADLKALAGFLQVPALTFATEEQLFSRLCLLQGQVSPMGLVNDKDAVVEVVVDEALLTCGTVGVHPNTNAATLWLNMKDLLRFIEANGNRMHVYTQDQMI